jgi:hypothetical protein
MILLKMPEGELHHWVLEAIVVEAAREHIISRRKTASILGFKDFESREAFFERHGLFIEYTMEMAEKDFKSIKHLEALRKRG